MFLMAMQSKTKHLRLKDYVEIVEKATGKPMLFGEFGPLPKAKDHPKKPKTMEKYPNWYESYEEVEKAVPFFQATCT